MTTSYVGEGKVLDYVAGGTITAGDAVITGSTVGIAIVDMVSGETGAIGIEGVFTVTKVAGTAWVQGDKIDWDASATAFQKGVTPAAGDVVGAGIASVAAASAATTAQLKLLGGALAAVVT